MKPALNTDVYTGLGVWRRTMIYKDGRPRWEQQQELPTRRVRSARPRTSGTDPQAHPRPMTNWNSYHYDGPAYIAGRSDWDTSSFTQTDIGPLGLLCNDVDFSHDTTGVYRRSVNGALAKLLDQDINFAVALKTFSESAETVATGCNVVAATIRAFRHSLKPGQWSKLKKDWERIRRNVNNLNRLPRHRKAVAQKWLELQYGIKPTLSDMHSAMEELYDQSTTKPPFVKVAKAEKDTIREKQILVALGPAFEQIDVDVTLKATSVFEYQLVDPVAASLSQMGLDDPLPVIWEVTKFSFILDWVYNVGDFLAARAAARSKGWVFIGGRTSVKTEMKASYQGCDVSFPWAGGSKRIQIPTYQDIATGYRFSRSVWPSWAPPYAMPPGLRLPWEATNDPLTRALNAIALVAGAFK